jgi:cation:H+ antiporter
MITVAQLVGGFILLLFGAEYLVRGAVSLARRLNVSPMLIGMTIVAYGTTAPELVVSLEAALGGRPGIAVGNVVGSNIANILLILGASAVIFPIVIKPGAIYRDAAVMLGSALLFVALALSGMIERWQGVLMFAALIVFSLYAYVSESRRGLAESSADDLAEEFAEGPKSAWLALLAIVGSVAAVLIGARLLVSGAVTTAQYLGVGEEVIGLTVVAVGTSLPELATAVVAAIRRHSAVAVGNIIGANIYNLLAIMGLVAAVKPIPIPPQILRFDLWFMLAVTMVLLSLLIFRGGLSRGTAILFVVAFCAYTALQYFGVEKVFG